MGRFLRLLITFGPMIYSFVKKFMNKNQTNTNLPQSQNPQAGQQQQQQQSKDGKWDFKEGNNPLG